MQTSVKWLSTATLVVVAALIGAPTAQAQIPIRPGVTFRQSPLFSVNPYLAQYGRNLAFLGQAYGAFYNSIPPYALGYNPYAGVPYTAPAVNPYLSTGYGSGGAATLTSNPYAASPGIGSYGSPGSASPYYSNPYTSYYDPYGGYFRGVADLTSAYGKYEIDHNRARLLNQEVERSKIETRRKIFDEWRYERMNMPTVEDVRQRTREIELTRARRDPPLAEVLTGSTLNSLLSHLKEAHAKGQRGPTTLALDEDALKKINVTSGHGGNIGLLKPLANSGKLSWPLSLRSSAFDKLRHDVEFHAEDAVNRAKINGEVDAALMQSLLADAKQLHKTLEDSVGDLSPGQYIEGKRFLNLLDDSLRALQDPNVRNYFNRKYEARGKTVSDLIDNMAKEGLTFAAASPGDEAAYRVVQTFLAAYDDALTRLASNK
ncbi:MAG: hypothetical protein HYS12_07910 [Planctomycetes bacterium]|nr:hypothetical protein [Planctomycetota bacterium]